MSPRSEKQNQQIKDERREKILKAAIQVFADKGYATTKITDIAAAAGMSHGLIYHYFASKEAVYAEIVEDAVQKSVQMSTAALEQPGTPWERIQLMCARTLAGIREYPEYYAIIVQVLTNPEIPLEVRTFLREAGNTTYLNMFSLIREGQESGQVVAGNPFELTNAYYDLIQGIAIRNVVARQQASSLQEDASIQPFITIDTVLRLLKA